MKTNKERFKFENTYCKYCKYREESSYSQPYAFGCTQCVVSFTFRPYIGWSSSITEMATINKKGKVSIGNYSLGRCPHRDKLKLLLKLRSILRSI